MRHLICILACACVLALCGCTVAPIVTEEPPTSVAPTEGTTLPTGPTAESTAATVPSETETTPSETTTTATKSTAPTTEKTKATTAPTTTEAAWKKDYVSRQILGDPDFSDGFGVVEQESTKVFGYWDYGKNKNAYIWTTAQWGLFRSYTDHSAYINFLTDRIKTAENILQSKYEQMKYDNGTLSLSVNTFDFFNGQGHTDNSSWPHLLIGQKLFNYMDFYTLEDEDAAHYTCAADKIILTIDLRMTNYRHEDFGGINACQFISFYSIGSRKDLNVGGIWFGVPFFDSRGYEIPGKSTFMMDGGTGMYMYDVPFVDVYDSTSLDGRYDFFGDDGKPLANDDWLRIEIDIKPYIEKMASQVMKGSSYNVFANTSKISDLYFKEMNIGFEIHGSFDVTFEIKNYSLTTYFKK